MEATAGSFLWMGTGGQRVERLGRDLLWELKGLGSRDCIGPSISRAASAFFWGCSCFSASVLQALSTRRSLEGRTESPVRGWGGFWPRPQQSPAFGSGKSHFWEAVTLNRETSGIQGA